MDARLFAALEELLREFSVDEIEKGLDELAKTYKLTIRGPKPKEGPDGQQDSG